MASAIAELAAEHRRIEAELDALARSLNSGLPDFGAFHRAWTLLRAHCPRERDVLAAIHPEAARKIAAQYAEALELASHIDEPSGDTVDLARRFVAIVQHTMIEVERDLFPLARD